MCLGVAMLAGCGQGQTAGAVPLSATAMGRAAHKTSGSYGDLLYATVGFHLSIYSYPDLKRLKIVNTFPIALGLWADSDAKTGDMCFDNYSEVYVYEHGATQPYATIPQPPSGEALDCAFDPTTNDLAITYSEAGNKNNWVSVYSPPYNGSPTNYSDPGMNYMMFSAYDANGDLFVDGQDSGGCQCLIDEMRKGSSKLIELQEISQLGVAALRWDGQYMTVTWPNVIYRFTVSDTTVTIVGKTAYKDVTRGDAFTIQGDTAIGWVLYKGAERKMRHIGFWHYPNGQKPFNIIKVFSRPKDSDGAAGIPVVSVAPSGSYSK